MSICCPFLRMPSAAMMPSICARRCSTRVTSPNRITPSIPTCKNGYITLIEIGCHHRDTKTQRGRDQDHFDAASLCLCVFVSLCLCGDTLLVEQPYARHNAFKHGAVSFEVECRRDSEKIPEQSIWRENSDHPVRF